MNSHRVANVVVRPAALLLAAAAVLWSPPTSHAAPLAAAQDQASPEGRTVEAVRISGNSRIDSDTIQFYLSTRVGVPFNVEAARLDYMALFNTNWFRNLVMRWEEGASGGIVLIVEVDELPVLRQVLIEGTDKVKPDELIERLELVDRHIEIGGAVNEQQLREGSEVLTFMLQGDQGLQFVQVELDLVDAGPGTQDAVYRVIEGDSVRIAQVVFDGNTVFSQRELRWALKRSNEHFMLSFLSKNDRYSEAGYEADMFQLRDLYLKHGYLEFSWGEPEVQVFTDGRGIWSDRQRLALRIPIYEGPQYHIGDVSVEGNTHFSDEELARELDLHRGDVFNVQQVRAAIEAIQTKYTNAGYLQVVAGPFPEQDPDTGTANLVIRVQENAVYQVNRVEFAGNTNTRDYVLRRNLSLHELARWDQSRFETSIERLYQLGYFQNVEHELATAPPGESLDPDVPADPELGSVNVDVQVQEVGRNQITFGGGLSALEGGFVQFGYTTRNLFGYGQTLSLSGQIGSLRQDVRLSFSDPYIFGKRLRFGADLFRDALDFPDFQREGTGFSVRLGKPLNERESLALFAEYNYEVIDIGQVSSAFAGISSPLYQALFLTAGRRVTSSIRPFIFYNKQDNPFLPSKGQRVSLSFEYAGGPLGGTLDYWKASARTTFWVPVKSEGSGLLRQPKQIIALNVRADWSRPLGDLDELPIFERFFLGGSNSVRGTRLRSIGPIDDFGNILGGTKGLQYNLEYIFALSPSLRVKAFHDAGQAWLSDESFNLADLRKTAGLEFEVFAPVFNVPFRFFWAYNFDPLERFGEQKSTFEFAIGQTF